MPQIGFGTGCLHKFDFNLDERMELYLEGGATAIELTFPTQSELRKYLPSEKTNALLNKFDYVSLHAPFRDAVYGNNSYTEKTLGMMSVLSSTIPFKGVVIHPDLVNDYRVLENSKLPFLIENMDPRKSFGIAPRDMEEIYDQCDYNFVLDIFHAYEFDNSLDCLPDFLEVMGDRLQHLHISGQNGSARHIPTHQSQNKDLVAKSLERIPRVPIISEGRISKPIQQSIKEEIIFLNQ